jgi:zinc protease
MNVDVVDDGRTLSATLGNGLRVLIREAHDAPIASFWTCYGVGSRDEIPGRTGLSHWVEHMQFKGTPSLGKGQVFRDVSRVGGVLNAFTSQDWTAYYQTVPVDRIDIPLGIEPDRMANSLFDPAEVESERTVILNERQGAENRPTYLLIEEVYGAAFRSHPYRHMVLGYENDLRAISRDDLYQHYRRTYVPDNAVVVVVGGVDRHEMLARIAEAFGGIPAGGEASRFVAREPAQLGERRVTLRRPAPTDYLWLAYHVPEASHPDTVPLLVLDAVLSGAKGLGVGGGGGGMGRSSRLYRALVASGLARGAGSHSGLSRDPGLLLFGVTGLPGGDTVRLERTLDEVIDRIRTQVVPDDEFARVQKQLKAQFVYSAAGASSQAWWLGQMALLGDHRRADTLVDEIGAVTPDDVLRVAARYLLPEQRTIGWLHPVDSTASGSAAAPDTVPSAPPAAWSDGSPDLHPGVTSRTAVQDHLTGPGLRPLERVALPSGIVVLGQVRPDDPVVVAQFRLQAGALAEPDDKPGLANFVARMLVRGQAGRSFEAFNELTDGLGASLGVDGSRLFVDVGIRCLREDFPRLLDLAADVLRQPDFPEDEIERVRQEILAGIRESEQSTAAVADLAMRQALYPAGHAYARRVTGEAESVAAITRDHLVRFHGQTYGRATLVAAVVGGVSSLDEVAAEIDRRFGDWQPGTSSLDLPAPAPTPTGTVRVDRVVEGKSQTDLVIGAPAIERGHPAYYALETANTILGRIGLSGRLGAEVREKRGLAYSVSSGISAGKEAGTFSARGGVSPTDAEQAISAMRAEIACSARSRSIRRSWPTPRVT